MLRFLSYVVLMVATSLGVQGPSKVSKDLRPDSSGAMIDVIVQFKQTPNETHHQKLRNKEFQTWVPVPRCRISSLMRASGQRIQVLWPATAGRQQV